jgi:hypothetical protein
MPIVIPAEGPLLDRVLETAQAIRPRGLSRRAFAQFDAAQMRTAWGRLHQRRLALVEGERVLASAVQYDLAATLDEQAVRVSGIAEICPAPTSPTGGPAAELVDRLLAQAAHEGAAMGLLFSEAHDELRLAGFDAVPMTDAEITVAEPPRRGAPMALIRGGEDRDLAAVVAMGRIRATPFRFHLERDVDFVQHAIMKKRLLAGLGSPGVRQLHFFIAEEGITAAAYVVISIAGNAWTIEECGDRDPSGARIGAILQALIAREPVERRPTMRGWLPRGLTPPQVTALTTSPSTTVMMVRPLEPMAARPVLSAGEVLYWRSDIL